MNSDFCFMAMIVVAHKLGECGSRFFGKLIQKCIFPSKDGPDYDLLA